MAEHVRVLGFADAVAGRLGLQLGNGVVADGIGLGRGEALALLGDYVQKLRAFQLAHIAQCRDQGRQIVAINRSDIVPAQLFEQGAGYQHAFGMLLGLARQFPGGRDFRQNLFAALAHMRIGAAGENLGQIVGHAADIARDRHVVVVEHHQHVGFQVRGMIQRLEGHARSQGAIANHRNCPTVQPLQSRGNGHAERRADRGAGVANAEGVVRAFTAPWEGGQTVLLPQRAHLLAAPGQNLVRVSLMAHIPDDPVFGCLIDIVQGHGQFNYA